MVQLVLQSFLENQLRSYSCQCFTNCLILLSSFFRNFSPNKSLKQEFLYQTLLLGSKQAFWLWVRRLWNGGSPEYLRPRDWIPVTVFCVSSPQLLYLERKNSHLKISLPPPSLGHVVGEEYKHQVSWCLQQQALVSQGLSDKWHLPILCITPGIMAVTAADGQKHNTLLVGPTGADTDPVELSGSMIWDLLLPYTVWSWLHQICHWQTIVIYHL